MMIVHGMKMYVLNEKLIPKRMVQHTRTSNAGCPLTAFDPPQKVNKAFLAERPVMPDKWDSGQAFHAFSTHIERDIFGPELIRFCDHHLLASKASKYNLLPRPQYTTQTIRVWMVTQGPFQEDYWCVHVNSWT